MQTTFDNKIDLMIIDYTDEHLSFTVFVTYFYKEPLLIRGLVDEVVHVGFAERFRFHRSVTIRFSFEQCHEFSVL